MAEPEPLFSFTLPAAKRISAAVRVVERMQPEAGRRPHRHTPQQRIKLAVLDEALVYGGTAEATIWVRDENGDRVATEDKITLADWYLEEGESIDAGERVYAVNMGAVWEVLQTINCPS